MSEWQKYSYTNIPLSIYCLVHGEVENYLKQKLSPDQLIQWIFHNYDKPDTSIYMPIGTWLIFMGYYFQFQNQLPNN